MYDFDKLLADYIERKGHVHEEDVAEVYEEWLNAFDDKLGSSPLELIDKMSDGELIEELKDECALGTPSYAVMESIEKRKPTALLTELLYSGDKTLVYCAAELLENIGEAPLDIYAGMLGTDDEELFELLVSSLKNDPNSVRETLLDVAAKGDMRIKTAIADILASGGRDERVFKLLCELFAQGDNIPLYAGYFARYGDERAAAYLYRALDTARYADYIEIRNAIEALGGIVGEERDFSSDPDYIFLKERKSGK